MTEELGVFVCSHVFARSRPVLLVCREDDEFQFLCGGPHGEAETPRFVGVDHLIQRDPSLKEMMDLPNNWEAERASLTSKWKRTKLA